MSIELYSPQYFATCAVGGVLSCGLSHTLLTPVDLAKCNAQANPQVYNKGMAGNLKLLMQQQGTIGAVRGWLPTLLGYSLQGANKFGWYEVFKHYYGKAVGDEFFSKYQSLVFMAASASAEFLADIMYVPFESIKVRVQTDMKMPASMVKSAGIMHKEEGMNAFFKSLSPLWARQIPYTIIKFVAFEKIVRAIYGLLPGDAADYNKTQKLGVTLAAGYSAGAFLPPPVCLSVRVLCCVVPMMTQPFSSICRESLRSFLTLRCDLRCRVAPGRHHGVEALGRQDGGQHDGQRQAHLRRDRLQRPVEGLRSACVHDRYAHGRAVVHLRRLQGGQRPPDHGLQEVSKHEPTQAHFVYVILSFLFRAEL
ncbi:MAG: hypothetical protein MHM6MM_004406 [Cercozoa sp. M6MM]